ncbi:hypothetical protein E5D57_007891 [Metarhizium anisopliae]|nr:hypothetical protein E5D57_007891 [Metarhizium anisopliae]
MNSDWNQGDGESWDFNALAAMQESLAYPTNNGNLLDVLTFQMIAQDPAAMIPTSDGQYHQNIFSALEDDVNAQMQNLPGLGDESDAP